jgi:hypothetical protein
MRVNARYARVRKKIQTKSCIVINVLMSRLDEQQRRWYAAVESKRYGYGGIRLVSQITGLDGKTIGRGRQELALDLEERPLDRVRLPGAGRPTIVKKRQRPR